MFDELVKALEQRQNNFHVLFSSDVDFFAVVFSGDSDIYFELCEDDETLFFSFGKTELEIPFLYIKEIITDELLKYSKGTFLVIKMESGAEFIFRE